ncbi:hypothetical protein UCDDA912_g07889 [Diaporthe ampelina]|uniref:DUF2293 domain-containing protein n=1 Tax=Diaporthe ampelina TaxID=1214573 RepID=A0A0G2HVU6_9PEZI|nr:hypothetical protein UCDDA912_g07889 [Diaporthe ampelina]
MSEAKVPKCSLPSGYSFVPKGNVFITRNCRRLTQACGCSVYVVIDAKNEPIGIGVPTEIHVGVQSKETDTRAERAANVLKRDGGIAKGFQKEIMKIFPKIPPDALRNVSRIALQKGKGKVGRVGKLNVQRRARLAVWAHVRHCETDYDVLLRNGVPREDARHRVEAKIKEVCKVWGSGSQTTRGKPGKTSTSTSSPGTAASQAIKKTAKPVAQITNERKVAVRNSKRAHRQKQSLIKLGKKDKKLTKQQKGAPKASSSPARVVATAASFREKRTPKPRVIPPIEPSSPTPPTLKARWTNPSMPNLGLRE